MNRNAEVAIVAGGALLALGWWLWPSTDSDEGAAESVRPVSRRIAEAKPRIAKRELPADRTVSDGEPPESAQAPLFEVGGRRFRSLQEAVDAAEPGATVTLEGRPLRGTVPSGLPSRTRRPRVRAERRMTTSSSARCMSRRSTSGCRLRSSAFSPSTS